MIEFIPLISYCFVMSATPGPNNVMLAITGANFGGRGALPVILGIQSGLFVQTLLMCMGLGSVFTAYPLAQQVLRMTGALYLVFLAWKLCRTSTDTGKAATAVSFTQAATFQALNPKSWLRSITVASVFMPAGQGTVANALLVTLTGAMIGAACNTMWAMFGMSIRRVLADPGKQRAFNWTMGASLLVLALMFLR
ncbi:LysE family translocator [Pseudoduganella ginsengisoli]|uniref:LysE family translocator n=1 Tax=Pseudoduganella ginsengisoli TaxID=1462440 RepID=A0A6L6Q3K7_9BURK|nr:LysE family translocator [Pseudoduganella ginsengisoli]MTW04433.1 LysE family translocator [Pseudoduganella ginsengisoli]